VIRINLLPHRAERRKAQRKQLGILAGVVVAIAVVIALLVHGSIAGYIAIQNDRNEFLKKEVADLDKQIEEIKKLKDDISALLARKQVIERLQTDRAQAVYLLDQLVRQTPDGVYLKSVKQTGLKVNITGYAQSNARVSTLMRNIASSPYLENPDLVEIKASSVNNKRLSEFTMNLSLKATQTDDKNAGKAGKAGGAAKAADAAKKG
jgi:type IV pilus assembly protein PilN